MIGLRFSLALLLLASAGCTPDQPPSATAEHAQAEAEVRKAVGQLTEALNDRDADRALSLYRESPEFVFLGCTDLMFGTRFFAGVVGPHWESRTGPALEREILRIHILGPQTAVVTLRGGSLEVPALFTTQVMVREADGRWLVAHEHQSWPGCREPAPLHSMGSPGSGGGPGVAP